MDHIPKVRLFEEPKGRVRYLEAPEIKNDDDFGIPLNGAAMTNLLQNLGGWKSMAMVERYAHVAPDDLAEATARLDSVLRCYDLATVQNHQEVEVL